MSVHLRIHRIAAACAAVIGTPLASTAWAQSTPSTTLEPVVISVNRAEQRAFDAPAAIDAVDAEAIRAGGQQVNLSESLVRVPGISILNRQNYAQDLQLSIRGFGARSTFGIRGVRVIIDGIPATMPDGQGQASSIALTSTQRIEVLRGPMAQLYGNAAGGVVQVISEIGADTPTVTLNTAQGRFGLQKYDVKLATTEGEHKFMVDTSYFETQGYRPHSDAQRGQLNARWRWQIAPSTRFDLVANGLDQPDSNDAIGLTRDQYRADPSQTDSAAITQDASKTVRQNQLGGVLEHKFSDDTTFTTRLYGGTRDLTNRLSTPPPPSTAQTLNKASGGMVEFARVYGGLGAQLAQRVRLGEAVTGRVTVGVDLDHMNEDRQGYINNRGVQGDKKRDEWNQVRNRDLFLQAGLDLGEAWSVTTGLRSSHVRFETQDRFIKAGTSAATNNPDDSGTLKYSATNPVLGLSFKPSSLLNLYANVGRGFETPTFTELAYRPNDANGQPQTGLNTDLKASRSRHAEIGSKWRFAQGHRLDLAVYDIRTTDEIVTDTNSGGRTTFKNASKTSRRGLELSYVGQVTDSLRSTLTVTWLKAKFDEAFSTGTGVSVAAGNKIPGIPQGNAFAELAWAPANAWGGFNSALEVVRQGRIYVNDANLDTTVAAKPAPGYADAVTLLNLRVGFAQDLGAWKLQEGLRVDNATDKRYAGSVIVNDANGRFFEPALPRNTTLWLTGRYTF